MKHRTRETDYGPIKYRVYGYIDVLPYEAVRNLTKKQVFQHINPNSVKNNIKKAQYRTGKYLYQLMWKIIIDHAIAGDIVHFPYDGKAYIGTVDRNSTKHANLHTAGRVYGLKILLNQPHTYQFKMRKTRRLELMQNIKNGKNYLNY